VFLQSQSRIYSSVVCTFSSIVFTLFFIVKKIIFHYFLLRHKPLFAAAVIADLAGFSRAWRPSHSFLFRAVYLFFTNLFRTSWSDSLAAAAGALHEPPPCHQWCATRWSH